MRIAVNVSMLFLVVVLSGCYSAAAGGSNHVSVPALSIQWLPPCQTKLSGPYFTVDLFANGKVQYQGSIFVKESGIRSKTIAAVDARLLIDAASDLYLIGSRELQTRMSGLPGSDFDESYCLSVNLVETHPSSSIRARSDAKSPQVLIRKLEQIVHVSNWICPQRQYLERSIQMRPGVNCKERPIVNLYIKDKGTCRSGHEVEVYADGTIYYYGEYRPIRGTEDGRNEVVLDDRYYSLSPDSLKAILTLIRGFHLEKESGNFESAQGNDSTDVEKSVDDQGRYITNRVDEIEQLRLALIELAGVRWLQFKQEVANPNRCAEGSAASRISLRHDFRW